MGVPQHELCHEGDALITGIGDEGAQRSGNHRWEFEVHGGRKLQALRPCLLEGMTEREGRGWHRDH